MEHIIIAFFRFFHKFILLFVKKHNKNLIIR